MKYQKGFSALILILAIALFLAVGLFVWWKINNQSQSAQKTGNNTQGEQNKKSELNLQKPEVPQKPTLPRFKSIKK